MEILVIVIGIVFILMGLMNILSETKDKEIFYHGIKEIIIGFFMIIIGILI